MSHRSPEAAARASRLTSRPASSSSNSNPAAPTSPRSSSTSTRLTNFAPAPNAPRRVIVMNAGNETSRGFPQYVREFHANFLALPALPSERLADASSDSEVVERVRKLVFVAASLLAVAPEVIGFPKAASRLAATINR